MTESPYDPFRTVVCRNGRIYKRTELLESRAQRRCSPDQEYAILSLLSGIPGTPKDVRVHYEPQVACISYAYIPGSPLDRVEQGTLSRLMVASKALLILGRVSKAGIAHGDIFLRNFILDAENRVHLIDFDQSLRCRASSAFAANFLGLGPAALYGSFIATFLMPWLVRPVVARLRKRTSRA
jgi:tRNA A-37 threonylcarbamoyl transferase component Bud32